MTIRLLFVFMLLGGMALGQDPPSYRALGPDDLPDAPSIHCQNGDPPLTGVKAKLVGACPFDVPLNEHFTKHGKDNGIEYSIEISLIKKRDPFFSWRKDLDGPLLKPTKKSWAIIIGINAADWLAYATCNHKIEEPHSELPALAVTTALSWFTAKAFSPAFGAAVPVYGTVHYARVH